MKPYTKAEPSGSIDEYGFNNEYDYQISTEIHAWEYSDENFDIVAEVFGGIRGTRARVWIEYNDPAIKDNPYIKAAIEEGMQIIRKDLDDQLREQLY